VGEQGQKRRAPEKHEAAVTCLRDCVGMGACYNLGSGFLFAALRDEAMQVQTLPATGRPEILGAGKPMPEALSSSQAVLEVLSPDGARRYVRVAQTPYLIGRGGETGNHLQLNDRRISRQCAAIVREGNEFYLEDRGQRRGLYVNGEKIESRGLQDGDLITFGLEDSYELVFRGASGAEDTSLPNLLTRIDHLSSADSSTGSLGLHKLNVLLEASSLLHSQLPLESVLAQMLDYAVTLTDADRGLLLEADGGEKLKVRLARRSGGVRMPPESMTPSQTAIQNALRQHSAVITEDLAQADMDLQAAQSIVAQRLRAVIVIPLYSVTRARSEESMLNARRTEFLGVVYLDSKRPAAFSRLDRQILDALAADAASILDNARLVEKERERQRLEQEINIARDIQQALLPRDIPEQPHLCICGCNFPCLTVGGDYFDVFPLSDGRTAFLIADVSGKGLGAALLTTMLQGALSGMTIGADPARVFNHINRFLCEHSEVGRYATMFFGILDAAGHLEFINAGHPSPILVRRSETSEAFTEGSFPVGLVPEARYAAVCLKLEPGDTLVLFSDGVTEAMDPGGQFFGIARLREVLQGKAELALDQMQKRILEAVETFTRGAAQADDVTLLLVRYRAAEMRRGSDTDSTPRSTASAA
jgi:phosphoserine phosphatase RsbU/P